MHKRFLTLPLSLLALTVLPLQADEHQWTGSTSNAWTVAENWQGNVAPQAYDILIFAGSKPPRYNSNQNDFAPNTLFNGFRFEDGPFTLSGNAIHLNGDISAISGTTANVGTSLHLLQAEHTFHVATGSQLVIQANVSGSGAIVKTGEGILQFYNHSNTFTGGITVEGGTLSTRGGGAGRRHFGDGILTLTSGNLSLAAATTEIAGLAGTENGKVANNGNDADRILTISTASTTEATFAGTLENGSGTRSLGLTKTGAGTQILTGNNTYTGTTTVSAGSLFVHGSLGATNVTVASNATFGGSGTIGGNVTLSGTLAPGASPGILTIEGDLTFHTSGTRTLLFEGGDLVKVGGTLTLNSGWALTLQSGFEDGGSVILFDYNTLGTASLEEVSFNLDALGFTPTSPLTLFNDTEKGHIVLQGISAITPIPEPSSLLFLSLATLAGGWALRRRS